VGQVINKEGISFSKTIIEQYCKSPDVLYSIKISSATGNLGINGI